MAGVVFHFEDNYRDVFSGRLVDVEPWIYAMKLCSDVNKAIVINTSGQNLVGLDRYFEWDIVLHLPELEGEVVFVSAPTNIGNHESLWTFDHKVDWYVFGPAAGWTEEHTRSITVPSANPQTSLHATHVASIVMAHRHEVITHDNIT